MEEEARFDCLCGHPAKEHAENILHRDRWKWQRWNCIFCTCSQYRPSRFCTCEMGYIINHQEGLKGFENEHQSDCLLVLKPGNEGQNG